jgi:hypothetical protein
VSKHRITFKIYLIDDPVAISLSSASDESPFISPEGVITPTRSNAMRELTTNEVELISGGDGTCGAGDPPPYSGGGGFNDWLQIFIIVW